MLEKILSTDYLALLGDKYREEELLGRYSPSLLGPLQV